MAETDPASPDFNLLAIKWRDLGFQYVFTDSYGFDEHEIAEFAVQFRASDVLGDGLLPTTMVATVLQRCGVLGENFNWFQLMQHLDKVDPYARGLLDFQGFLELNSYFKMPMTSEREIVEAFAIFDRDGSQAIDSHELMHVMKTVGDFMTEDEADKMIKQCDKDGNGTVEYWEFAKMVLSEF
jgi:calmodulin